MIHLTRLDGTDVVVNCELIVTVEKTPDTMLALMTGQRLLVREPVEDVVARIFEYRHRAYPGPAGAAPAMPPVREEEKE